MSEARLVWVKDVAEAQVGANNGTSTAAQVSAAIPIRAFEPAFTG
jgi:hypothetical protein